MPSLSVLNAIFLNSNEVDAAELKRCHLSFSSDIETNGVIKLSCISGNERISVWANSNKVNSLSLPFSCNIDDFDQFDFILKGKSKAK